MKAIVVDIQVGGFWTEHSLKGATHRYIAMLNGEEGYRAKMIFAIRLSSGEIKLITIRDEDDETVAYGDFEGLPSFLDYSKEVLEGK